MGEMRQAFYLADLDRKCAVSGGGIFGIAQALPTAAQLAPTPYGGIMITLREQLSPQPCETYHCNAFRKCNWT